MSEELVPSALQDQLAQLAQIPEPSAAPAEPNPPAVPASPAINLTPGAKVLGKTASANSPAAPTEDWEHKYNVLQGMFNKNTSDLREQNRLLEEQLKEARESSAPAAPSTGDVSDADVQGLVAQNLIDEFGMDYWKQQIAIQRTVAATAMPQADTQRLQQVEQQMADQNRQAFYGRLTQMVPNWEQINGSAEWNAFLGQIEPLTGATYEALLMDAYEVFDASRAAQLFQTFLSTPQQAPGFNGLTTPAPMVPTSVPQGGTLTPEEWAAQMQAISAGGYSPVEVIQKQNELMSAWTQGRVAGMPAGSAPPAM